MAKHEEYVSITMMRKIMHVQKETIMAFFPEIASSLNIKIDTLQKDVYHVKKELCEIKGSMTFIGDEWEVKVKGVDNKIAKVVEEITNVKKLQGKIISDNTELESKSVDIEDRNRRNNLRIDGLIEGADEKDWEDTKNKVKKLFVENLEIANDIRIERAHRVGNGGFERVRTIMLKLHDFKDKAIIMDKANKLKGTNIYINEDFSETTRRIRKELFAQAKTHRQNGYYAKVLYNKLIVHEFKQKNIDVVEILPTI
ncbi:uncharacterized protein LOC136094469 [Hydra vulgaris]|uniref:uncharacterized protein LOC136094469 n=1 Tax=Hydra vulgaris TaxID=6087 RepID=UPI0032E9D8E5